ncbi:MAG: DUF5615 family PIN-like protein [Nostocales cyanobacterium 94392]|nr:DUF5615 family PIN-like protein [Nostocales cyanobacterium 94392]
MNILIDMNLTPDWVEIFESFGFEAVHWSSVGDPAAKDSTIMKWAIHHGYIVFTNDLDFGTLLALNEADAPSVIQIRTQDVLPFRITNLVINSLHQFQTELEEGALITIDEARSKARVLPIKRN